MIDLFQPGAYARSGGGNLERPDIQKPVIRWMSWSINSDNGGGGGTAVWDHCRALWAQNGIADFPWLHIRKMEDLQRLISVGEAKNSPAIGANIEDVVGDKLSLQEVGGYLLDFWVNRYEKPVHMATLPWVQNGQGWQYVSFAVAALEIFPDEQTNIFPNGYDPKVVQDCIEHALAEGLPKVTLMFKTRGYTKLTYGEQFSICHSLYTGDDIDPNVEAWAAWIAPTPCMKLAPAVPDDWYDKPYLTGPAVGPENLPRPLYPPSAGKGTFKGDDVTAFKRAISRAGRLLPWSPSTWNNTYGETFACGDGSGNVGKSGVRGFQRQQWPSDKDMQTGNIGDKTYQSIRRALVSNPDSPHFKEPLLDSTAVKLLQQAADEFDEDAKITSWRNAVSDFCTRAEKASDAAWTYSQARPFTGLGVAPEKNHVNDCSSYAILAYYWGRTESGLKVPDPSDYEYTGYGNTWDDLDGHPKVTSGSYLVGDLAHYDGHVTICKKAGSADSSRWSSFGSEPKPQERTLYYRSDFVKVVRPPLA